MKPRFVSAAVCWFVFLIALWPLTAGAQSAPRGVAATGTAENTEAADVIRMEMTIEAKASNIDETIKLLLKKKKQATIRIEKLGAIEDSIVAGEIQPSESGDSAEMMTQLKRMLGDDERLKKAAKIKPPVTLELDLTCEWALEKSESTAELLTQCNKIKTEVVAADVGCSDIPDELSEEQEEIGEEMQTMMNQYSGSTTTQTGTPSFSYVRRIKKEDSQKLFQQAFKKAEQKAQSLAKLASRSAGTGSTTEELDDGSFEVSSTTSPMVEHSVTVAAVFEMNE